MKSNKYIRNWNMKTDALDREIKPGDIVVCAGSRTTLAFLMVETVARLSVRGIYGYDLDNLARNVIMVKENTSRYPDYYIKRKFDVLYLMSKEEFIERMDYPKLKTVLHDSSY